MSCSRDVAVGFRAQSGPDQWLVYRSLGPAGNRTVIGPKYFRRILLPAASRLGEIKSWIETEVNRSRVASARTCSHVDCRQPPPRSRADRPRRRIMPAAVPEEITLVGVTKYVGARETAELVAAGCMDLGESRPQELWDQRPASSLQRAGQPRPRWHLIGHLQRNKVRRTLPLVTLIHSVDSERLLAAIDAEWPALAAAHWQ